MKEKIEKEIVKKKEHDIHDIYKQEMRRKNHEHTHEEDDKLKNEENQRILDEECLTKIESICFEEIVREQEKPVDGEDAPEKKA